MRSQICRQPERDEPKNLTDECVLQILSLIKEGRLQPGDRVGEISIAQQIGMSRAPTRSALDRLAQANVLERVPRAGTFVRELSLEEFSEIMDVRAYLECLSARLAAQRVTPEQTDQLKALAAEADRLNRDGPEVPQRRRLQVDTQFHNLVAALSGNHRLIALLENQHLLEFSFLSGFRFAATNEHLRAALPTHEAIARAISRRQVDEAGDLMKKHILRSKQMRLSLALGES